MSDTGYNSTLLDLFRTELDTHSLAFAKALNGVEPSAEGSRVEPLARAAHSLKGAARIVGLKRAAQLAQAMETLLAAAQNGTHRLSAGDIDNLRGANELFRQVAAGAAADIPGKLDGHKSEIEELSSRLAASPAPAVPEPEARAAKGSAPSAAAPMALDSFLLDLFRTELETHSRVLEEGLVETEARQDPAKLHSLMRAAHSLKGAARIIKLDAAVRLAHAMEDLLSAAQKGERQLAGGDFDLLLRATDVFSGVASRAPSEIPAALAEASPMIDELAKKLAGPSPSGSSAASPPPTTAPPPPQVLATPAAPAEKVEAGSVRVSVDNLNRLTGLAGQCLVEAKTLHPLTQTVRRIKQRHSLLSNAVEQALEALRKDASLDAQLLLEDALQQAGWIHAAIPSYMTEFARFARKLGHLANRLYDEAVASRMRPFSDGLHGFARMVRDLAKSLGRNVRFEVEGESTPVDRDILEKLEAPLTHLLRNAVDHGIEPPQTRLREGKLAEGKLILSARHVAGTLEIVVADDGGGINTEQIRRRIVSKGHTTPDLASKLSESEILDFLFLPGFSTAQQVTEVSGRGVGLDVVQSMVRQVGGNVRVESQLGQGTRFTLQLPLTLSVLRTMLFEIKGQAYALPLTGIDRVLSVPPEAVLTVEGRQYLRVGAQNIGLVDAPQVLDVAASERPAGDLRVVVLSDRLSCYGLAVDRLLGERDLVVIPLPARLGKVPNVNAGAIMEDGSPVVILDNLDLVRSIDNLLTRGSLARLRDRAKAEKAARKRVLVVDDSLTVREVERRLLENNGYEVMVAVDGMDGWNAVQSSHFDLVVTDVDMPRIDGIELVRRIKSAALTTRVPVMIVSYKDEEQYRTKGLEAGASYYLTKSSFHDETLVNAVRDLIGEAET